MRALIFLCMTAMLAIAGEPVKLVLPTANTALFDGKPEDFYQFIDRDFRGEKTTPWEGGQYGFVRDPVETEAGVVMKRFHEGIDIKPVHRDARGIPLDEVGSIADGTIVYVNERPSSSNYGRYIVIRHVWDGSPYFSLYAHLASSFVQIGDEVKAGRKIGILGSTGAGVDNRRAHLHLELNLLLADAFENWHTVNFPTEDNKHGIYNGLNLAGIDIAAFYLALRRDPTLTLPAFLAAQPVVYRTVIPKDRPIHMLRNYPWLLSGEAKDFGSWEVSLTAPGVPVRIAPVARVTTEAALSWLAPLPSRAEYFTKRFVTGTSLDARLSVPGLRYLDLIAPPMSFVALPKPSPSMAKQKP